MNGHLRIYVELRGHGARGPRYRVRMNKPDGIVIAESTTEPLLDAARVLMSKGITGKIEMWDGSRPFPRMRGDIEHMAKLTVSEGDSGITLRRYAERTMGGDFEPESTSGTQNETGRPGLVLQGDDYITNLDEDLAKMPSPEDESKISLSPMGGGIPPSTIQGAA